eukprot:GGOE01003964.1.p1 GENE.GGOE01003964.1~~GGOE01003964.1.p1  ORF type:complete len:316 (+),score=41.76 GGOE01003964.1:39-950(+)
MAHSWPALTRVFQFVSAATTERPGTPPLSLPALLPAEVLSHVAAFCSLSDAVCCAAVCVVWRDAFDGVLRASGHRSWLSLGVAVSYALRPFPVLVGGSACVSDLRALQLLRCHPGFRHIPRLHRVHSTKEDGFSLSQWHRRCADVGPCFVIVRDARGHVFGAFIEEGLRLTSAERCIPHESVLFQLEPWFCLLPSRGRPHLLVCHRDHFSLAPCLDHSQPRLGRQPETPALGFSGDLGQGTSYPSVTFGSPCLAVEVDFEVAVLETWGMQPPPLEAPTPSVRDTHRAVLDAFGWGAVACGYTD